MRALGRLRRDVRGGRVDHLRASVSGAWSGIEGDFQARSDDATGPPDFIVNFRLRHGDRRWREQANTATTHLPCNRQYFIRSLQRPTHETPGGISDSESTKSGNAVLCVEVPLVVRHLDEFPDLRIGRPGTAKCGAYQLCRHAGLQEGADVGPGTDGFERWQARQIDRRRRAGRRAVRVGRPSCRSGSIRPPKARWQDLRLRRLVAPSIATNATGSLQSRSSVTFRIVRLPARRLRRRSIALTLDKRALDMMLRDKAAQGLFDGIRHRHSGHQIVTRSREGLALGRIRRNHEKLESYLVSGGSQITHNSGAPETRFSR